jgi:RHS repeat-associated protein
MTDAAKATIWQATWKPWGEVQSITGAVAQNLRFPGQYFQVETGLAYNWHRTYDPVTGRYTQPDPLRFVDGPAIYQYAMASPFMRTDRDGQEVIGGNGKRDWKLPQCIGCIEWPPKNGGASGDGGTGSNEGGSSGGWLNWLFPPIPQPEPQMCMSRMVECTVKCIIQEIVPGSNCPPVMTMTLSDWSYTQACRKAEKGLNSAVPRGCYKRHCDWR